MSYFKMVRKVFNYSAVSLPDSALDLRIEWCKSRARADRWYEEVQLLLEEMRRVCKFFESREAQWTKLTADVELTDGAMKEGHVGYARQQAAQYHAMRAHCQQLWRYVGEYVQTGEGVIIPPEARVAEGDESL